MASVTDTGYSKQDWHPGEDYWDHYPPGPFDQGWEDHYHGRGAAGDRRLRDAVETAVSPDRRRRPPREPYVVDERPTGPGKVFNDPGVMHGVDYYERRRGIPRGGYYGPREVVDRRGAHGHWHNDDIMMAPSRDTIVVPGNARDSKRRVEELTDPYFRDVVAYSKGGEEPKKGGSGAPGGPGKAAAKTEEKKQPDRKELYDRSTLVSPEQVDWAKTILKTGKMPNGKDATAAQKMSAQNMLAGYERDKNRGAVLFPDPGQEVPVSKGADGKGTPYEDRTTWTSSRPITTSVAGGDRHNDTGLPEANTAKYKKAAEEQKRRLAEEDRKKEAARQKEREAAAAKTVGTEWVDSGEGYSFPVAKRRGMEDVLREEREAEAAKAQKANDLVGQAQSRYQSLMTEAAKYGGRYTSFVRYYNDALAKGQPHAQALQYAHNMMKKSK